MAFRENDGDRHEVSYGDGEIDYMQLETLHVRHDRPDEETLIRVMWMLQRSDLDEDTLSKQLDIDKLHKTHKRKAEFNGDKKTVLASKKRQLKPKKKRKNQPQEEELSENSDPLSELPSESAAEESDEEQPKARTKVAPKKRQLKPKKKRKSQPQEEELSENSDPLSELPSESEESDEAATETAVQAQPQTRYSRRNRKQRVEINIDHAAYRTGWGASDTQKRKKK